MNYQLSLIALFLTINVRVLAQTNTITSAASTTSRLIPISGLECYGTYSGGPCLTASYILVSCNDNNNGIDARWGCLCSNRYDSAWSQCNSCQNYFNATNDNFYSTAPYLASCSSILSVLSSVSAASTSGRSSAASLTSASLTPSPSQSGTAPAPTAASTSRTNGAKSAQQTMGTLRNAFLLWALFLIVAQ